MMDYNNKIKRSLDELNGESKLYNKQTKSAFTDNQDTKSPDQSQENEQAKQTDNTSKEQSNNNQNNENNTKTKQDSNNSQEQYLLDELAKKLQISVSTLNNDIKRLGLEKYVLTQSDFQALTFLSGN